MLTLGLYGLLAILLAGVLFLAAAYLLPSGEQIAAPIRDEPIWDLPAEKRLDHADISAVRLPVALRGYRFAETDLLLDRLADELQAREDEIARLRTGGGPDSPVPLDELNQVGRSPAPRPDIDEPASEHGPSAHEPREQEPREYEPREHELREHELREHEPSHKDDRVG